MLKAAAVLLVMASSAQAQTWESFAKEDPITTKKTVVARLVAITTKRQKPREIERFIQPIALYIRCSAKNLEVVFYAPGELMAGDSRNAVDYRFDQDKPAASRAWQGSSDHSGIALWETARAKAFIAEASGKKKLAFRSETNVFGRFESEFDITGISEAVQPVLSACKTSAATDKKRTTNQ